MAEELRIEDQEQLRLLSIFHYVVGGLETLFALFPSIHLAIGVWMLSEGPAAHGHAPAAGPPVNVGWFFVVFSSVWIVAGLGIAACVVVAGRYLGQYRRRTFCMAIAAVNCLFVPFGTILGVFTLTVLMRPQVRAAFEVQPAVPPGGPFRT